MKIIALSSGPLAPAALHGLFSPPWANNTPNFDVIYITGVAHDFGLGGLRICPDLDAAFPSSFSAVHSAPDQVSRLLNTWGLLSTGEAESISDVAITAAIARNIGAARGWSMARTTAEQLAAAGVSNGPTIQPVSDDPIELHVIEPDGDAQRGVHVRHWLDNPQRPEPLGFAMAGLDAATAAPGVLDAIRTSDVVVLGPMSPMLDAAGILGIAGVRDALRGARARVVVLSPIGLPSSRDAEADSAAWRQAGLSETSAEIARLYSDFADLLIIDEAEAPGRYPAALQVARGPLAAYLAGDDSAADRLRELVLAR